MRKLFIVSVVIATLLNFHACKKDPKQQPPEGGGGSLITKDVNILLPQGSKLESSTLKTWSMLQTHNVTKDGKSKVPFAPDGCELVFVTDASDNIILMGYIHEGNNEISVKTTAQVILYHSLGYNFLQENTRLLFMNQTKTAPKLADYYTKMEQAFKADPLMVEKRGYENILKEVAGVFKLKPIDVYAKQTIFVEDDTRKSSIDIENIDDQNININNYFYRRAHAFVYKTSFINQSNQEVVIHTNIDYNDAADKEMKVNKPQYTEEAGSNYATGYGHKKALTGPVELPLASTEKEAIYKIRVVGPGAPTGESLTEAEKAKLDELYYEYLAYDIIAPYLLDVIGRRSLITEIDEDNLKPFYDKVKAIADLDPQIMSFLKDSPIGGISSVNSTPIRFFNALDNAGQSRIHLVNTLMECFRKQYGDEALPSEKQITDGQKQVDKFLDFFKQLSYTPSDAMIFADPDFFNTMEEFKIAVKDNSVKVNPKKSDVMRYVNHPLSVEADPALDPGETIEYEWITAGTFGKLYEGSTGGSTKITTTSKTINYKGETAPDDNNIERVIVTVYVKNSNGTKVRYGSDTATINVKKAKMEMRPDDATLSPSKGISSVKLYIVNAGGINPLANNTGQYRIDWVTAGNYGHFTGGLKQATTSVNSLTYISTDDEVLNAVENITARVYFKLSTGWVLIEEVKGIVNIDNELKKKIIHVPIGYMHGDTATMNGTRNVCYWSFIASIPEEPNAVKYEARVLSTTYFQGGSFPAYSWKAVGPYPNTHAHYVIPPYTNGTFNISFSNSGGTTLPGEHIDFNSALAGMTGIAEVTIWVK